MATFGVGETIALTAVSLAATAASTGISYYSQQQQAQNAQAVANYNAAMQRQNADIQARIAQQQSTWNQQQTMAQYQAAQNNAQTVENQAAAREQQAQAQADQAREQGKQLQARQRAVFAKSNVQQATGSPLLVAVDTAKNTELAAQDAAYQGELEVQQLHQKAADERFQSGFSLMDASIQKYQAATTDITRQIAYRQADLTQSQGAASAQGYRTESYGTLLSGASKIAGQAKGSF